MKGFDNIFIVCVLIAGLTYSIPAAAEMSKHGEHGKSSTGHQRMKHGKGSKMEQHHGRRAGHLFGSHWKDTLTDQQKKKADRMHVALKKSISVVEAMLKVKRTELSNLVVQDNPDTKAIHSKIDEILKSIKKVMRNKYDHMVEMRDMLTSEQRVSFDMGLLKKAGKSRGHGRH